MREFENGVPLGTPTGEADGTGTGETTGVGGMGMDVGIAGVGVGGGDATGGGGGALEAGILTFELRGVVVVSFKLDTSVKLAAVNARTNRGESCSVDFVIKFQFGLV